MRKLLLILSGIIVATVSFAESVTRDEANNVANVFVYGIGTKANMSSLKQVSVPATITDDTNPSFYVFNRDDGNGFVIVSGDTRLHPILAYSNESRIDFGNLPPNLEEWFRQIDDFIANDKDSDGMADNPGWIDYRAGNRAYSPVPIVSYQTAKWNQTDPYNLLCPTINGKKCYTGCTATALAIIMRYYRHPLFGNGYTDQYSYTDETGRQVTMAPESLSETFDWNNMPINDNTRYWNQTNKNAVSRLMYLCALMCHVNFGTAGSSGSLYSGHQALQEFLDYDKSSMFHQRTWYSEDEWQQIICNNLDNVGPLLYSASSIESGHAFVIDGYDSEYRFHINWGWGDYTYGSDDGYFVFPGFLSYKYNHHAVLGLKPNEGGNPVQYLSLSNAYGCKGISLVDTDSVSENEQFTINCGFLYANSINTPFNGYVVAVTIDREGNLKEFISEERRIELESGYGYQSYRINCKITQDIDVGDKLTLFFKNDNDDTWKPVLFDLYNVNGIIPIYDQLFIDESTTIQYLPDDKSLIINMKGGVEYSFGMDNTPYLQGVSIEGESVIIDTSVLPKGKYDLSLKKKKESVNLSIVL